MSTITFGGLASGLDTGTIVAELMKLERRPIERLENDRSYFTNRLKAFSDFDTKLKSFLSIAEELDTAKELVVNKSTLSSEGFFSVNADASALAGTYNVEVVSLARQEKEVSSGVADGWTSAGGDVTLNGQTVSIAAGSTLGQIQEAINGTADIGLKATIINDGTATPNRLVLTADDAGVNGVDITASTLDLAFSPTQAGAQAHIVVDGIDVYSSSNSISGAISGATIDLLKENAAPGDTTTIAISTDHEEIAGKIEKFVGAYNDIFSFINNQKDSSWSSDSTFRSVTRRMQNMLVDAVGGSGNLQTLAELGFRTDKKDGSLTVDSTKLSEAIRDDLDSVVKLFAGESGVDGVASKFQSYLDSITDFVDGIYSGKKTTTDSTIRRIDSQIEMQEARLSQRERTLRAQFDAMETLLSGMNAQSSFLTQQMTMLSNLGASK